MSLLKIKIILQKLKVLPLHIISIFQNFLVGQVLHCSSDVGRGNLHTCKVLEKKATTIIPIKIRIVRGAVARAHPPLGPSLSQDKCNRSHILLIYYYHEFCKRRLRIVDAYIIKRFNQRFITIFSWVQG